MVINFYNYCLFKNMVIINKYITVIRKIFLFYSNLNYLAFHILYCKLIEIN